MLAAVTPLRAAPQPVRRARSQNALRCRAEVKEPKTGVAFPATLQELRCLGAGVRVKALLGPVGVRVYAVALYAEPAAAAAAADATSLLDSASSKALLLRFVRTVTSEQFVDALKAELASKVSDQATLDAFNAFFHDKLLVTGSGVLMAWAPDGTLTVSVLPAQSSTATASLRLASVPAFARALFSVFLGPASIVPEARAAWEAGARSLRS
jgi:hypothetical protein